MVQDPAQKPLSEGGGASPNATSLKWACVGAERTMALLAFEDTRSSPVADLMDISQRQKTASELNAAILSSQCQVSSAPVLHPPECMLASHRHPSTGSCHVLSGSVHT